MLKAVVWFISIALILSQDVNSELMSSMLWSYLQLRPDEIYQIPSGANQDSTAKTTINAISLEDYGSTKYATFLKKFNPALGVIGDDTPIPDETSILLPNIIKCTTLMDLTCLTDNQFYVIKGGTPPKLPLTSADTIKFPYDYSGGRMMQQVMGNPVVNSMPSIIGNLDTQYLSITIYNLLTRALKPTTSGPVLIPARSSASYEKVVAPLQNNSITYVNYETFWGHPFNITIVTYLKPVAEFPHFDVGEQNWIQVIVSNKTVKQESPLFYAQNDTLFWNTSIGPYEPNLNFTISLDSDFTTEVTIIVDEFFGGHSQLGGYNNDIRQIYRDTNKSIEVRNIAESPHIVHTNKTASSTSRQAWRFIHLSNNRYRLVNAATGLAVGVDEATRTLKLDVPKEDEVSQIWTVIRDKFCVSETECESYYFIKSWFNDCWYMDSTHEDPLVPGNVNILPLRLDSCGSSKSFQQFQIEHMEVNSATFWV